MKRVAVVLTLTLLGLASALECEQSGSEYRDSNPIGTCACDGQVWVAPGCLEGYWCEDTSGSGCYKTCAAGEFLATDYINDNWECVTEAATPLVSDHQWDFFDDTRTTTSCPVETGYHVCPGDGDIPTPLPPAEVTENPFGTCRCNGEIWLAEGCAYGFYCDDAEDIGGVYLFCEEGENLHVDFDTKTWDCTSTPGNCPGGEILGTGCPVPICQYSINPYGECKCENQLFISSDCSQGFRCYDNLPDPYLFDGCLQRCLNGQIVVPDFETKSMRCIDAPEDFRCPGNLQMFCPEDDVGTNFTRDHCECNGQLTVSSDCSESFYCLDRLPAGGAGIKCPEDQIVDVNFLDYSWTCTNNTDNCPSAMGGFELGCPDEGENPIPAPQNCTFGVNEIVPDGCECNGQMFVNNDCSQMFYCSNYVPNDEPGAEGCLLDCPAADGLRTHIDLVNREWDCVPRENNYICPGKLQLDCSSDFAVSCECEHQLWINEDCTQGFWCNGVYDQDNDNQNPGSYIKCPEGLIISLTFIYPPRYQCVPDEGQCPGSFHFGCDGGDFDDLTTSTTTPTIPTDPTDDPNTTEEPTEEPITNEPTEEPTEEPPVTDEPTEEPTEEPPVTTTEAGASSLAVSAVLVSVISLMAKLIN